MKQDRGVDLQRLATDRRALVAGQYASKETLESRISIYAYLVQPDQPAAASGFFEAWVVDHVAWSGRETAIDVGCGPGAYFPVLRYRARTVVGVDLSFGMLPSVTTERKNDVVLVTADLQELPMGSDSADVVVCAHMLYHVPDIAAAIGEVCRVLRSGGYLLVAANGANEKAEIREIWTEAASDVLGRRFRPPAWGQRFNLDIGPPIVAQVLGVVTVDRSGGASVLPDRAPALIWIDTLRPGSEDELSEEEWEAIAGETRRRIREIIACNGSFVVTKSSGVLVARLPDSHQLT